MIESSLGTPKPATPARATTLRAGPLLAGVGLLAIYVRIGALLGFQAWYGPPLPPNRTDGPSPFTYVSGSEHRFWLAHLVLALPGALLISWGLAPRLGPLLLRFIARVDNASPRTWRWAGLALFVALFVWSAVGRHAVVLDRPLTDDENAVTFGARMLAAGHLRIPALQPAGAFTDLFTYQRDGMVSAMDFPGVLMFGAASILTGLGSLLYALASALSGVAVAYAAGRWFGPRARVLAAVIWIVSPMISSLSFTSHGHVASRMFVALALAFAARLDTHAGTPRRDAVLIGMSAGLGFLCRPLEILCLLAPLGAWLTWRSLRAHLAPRTVPVWIAGGLLPGILVFAWYNLQTTGVWYLQARFAPGTIGGSPAYNFGAWDRLGFNLGFDVIMLAVFFLGVPMIAAVIGGLDRRRPILVVLAAGVLANVLLCLAHDNTGIHSVGPIHFSEMTVPLTVVATAGILRGFAWLSARNLSSTTAGILLAGYLVLSCGMFSLSNLASLRAQATTQAIPDKMLEALDVHHAIVIAQPYIVLLQIDKTFAPAGSWVLEYPHPDPFLTDDVIFAKASANPEALHRLFPDRALYEMSYAREQPSIRVTPLEQRP
ncbi:MAG: hypothetical protein JWO36_7251 [Myxococcales bacterium]|nr:hypothetical protein [Myxococcales bacterium]